MTVRTRIAVAAAAALALAATACSSDGSSGGTGADGRHSLSLNFYQGVDVSIVPYMGDKLGIFEKDGLDVKLVPTTNGPATTAALLSGDLDMVTLQVPGLMQLAEQGKDVEAVTGIFDNYPFSILASPSVSTEHKDQFPQALLDLKGKTFGVDAIGGVSYNIIRALMKEAGMNPDRDVKFVAIGTTAQLATALQNEQIDAFNALPTDVVRLVDVQKKANQLIDLGASGAAAFTPWQLSAYFAQKSQLDDNPDAYKAFQKGWKDTVAYMQDPANADEVDAMVGQFLNLDPDQAATLLDEVLPLLSGDNNPAAFTNIGKFLVDAGILKSQPDVDSLIWTGGAAS